jgi:hypothetical protein
LQGIEKKTPAQWQRSDLEFIAKDGAVTAARDRLVNGFAMLHQRDMEVLVKLLDVVYPAQIQGVAALKEKVGLLTANKQNAEDMKLEVVIYKQADNTITESQNLRTRCVKEMEALHLVCRETCDEKINYAEWHVDALNTARNMVPSIKEGTKLCAFTRRVCIQTNVRVTMSPFGCKVRSPKTISTITNYITKRVKSKVVKMITETKTNTHCLPDQVRLSNAWFFIVFLGGPRFQERNTCGAVQEILQKVVRGTLPDR